MEPEEKSEEDRVQDVLDVLRSEGNRVTTSRRILIRCLVAASGHQTAEELTARVQDLAPDVHLSTIYRNLDELERLGIVSHSHLGHGPATYHLASKVHGHLVCEDCAAMIEAPDELFSDLARVVFERHGFVIDPHHFAVLGTCETCRALAESGQSEAGRGAGHGHRAPAEPKAPR